MVKLFGAIKELYWKAWYSYLSRKDPKATITFMNYGYQDDSITHLKLAPGQEKDRFSIQMYDFVAGSIPGGITGENILEVGCGRGGGAEFVATAYAPQTLTGIDLCEPAIAFCKKVHQQKNLSFIVGDAMNLPFADNSFEAVMNIESSHRYPNMPKFLSEVHRVLKPGGYFSFVDFRATEKIPQLEQQMRDSGLTLFDEQTITPQVIRALELDDPRKLKLVSKLTPWFFYKLAREFASVVGSSSYQSLASRKREYLHFLLRKN